ncbi:four helix bundle protein [Leeuwenhoekiella polynyae]|uniref:Four helix bundle protein n=1 Tax=Leeuwenhoekiella polynyae TaxID=1550906 RepID=A0A4Q0PHD1_9FLAO|nr:four helix bundle protein [Leeuwenhoekiella polynyae]RXG26386.1 four helix bundle protein [Leeuwenhoekiella polynyae]|tara:strand:- start:492 stop:836 length:345 start_codon:yes stop_codon:yes gene_type:complete
MAYVPRNNAIVDKSFHFACDIVIYTQSLKSNGFYEIGGQLLKSGTSIGANIRESQRAVSTKDFKNKLGIALKEAEETQYWMQIIEHTGIASVPQELPGNCEELIKLLVSIIKNS